MKNRGAPVGASFAAALALVLGALLVAPAASAGQIAPAAPAGPTAQTAAAERTVTLTNQDAAGNPTTRFDVDGNAIDAHDGQIQRFGDLYYLYGTSYGCGYRWNTVGAPFCGFVSYSSPDLVHWTPRGPLFDASTDTWQERCDGGTYGCYRPHVVYNASTQRYVLWINTYDVGVGYRVFTSTQPDTGFVEAPVPDLAAPEGAPRATNYGDQSVFVDHDGAAYLVFTDWIKGGDLIVEKLDPTYTTGSGQWSRVGLRSTEAPTIFERAGTYYLTYSDPNRGYATTGTGYVTASSPLGPWHGQAAADGPWTVTDGVLTIVGGDTGLSRAGADWTDYTFHAQVTPLEATKGGYAQVGFVFRSSDAGSYQWLLGNYAYPGQETGNLTKLIPGKAASRVPVSVPIVTGHSYAVDITVQGSTIETRVDGVLVDSTVDPTLTSGRVGFRESVPDGEGVQVSQVTVTAGAQTLMSDDFSDGLAQWDRPVTGTNLTTTSCGGQPADVLPIVTSAGTVYLYQSDVWMNGAANEALAKQYWAPLGFDDDGAVLPIVCQPSVDVTVPVGPAGLAPASAAVTTGDEGFQTYGDIRGNLERAQTFTVPAGRLTAVRYTSFQTGLPDAGLTLTLRRVAADGSAGDVVTSSTIPVEEVSWAPTWQTLTLPDAGLTVAAGERFLLAVGSTTTTGGYGMMYRDTAPYPGGQALISHDAGASWSPETGRTLRLQADLVTAPGAPTGASAVLDGRDVRVSWSAPDQDGGTPVTGYRVYRSGVEAPVATVGAQTTTARLTGLTPGDRVALTVTALNVIGESPRSGATAVLTVPPVVTPSVASSVVVVPAAGTVKVGARTSVTVRVVAPGAVSPVSGTVTVLQDGRKVGSVAVGASGAVKVTVPAHAKVGSYVLTATYSGSAGIRASVSRAVSLKVAKAKAKVSVKVGKKKVKPHAKVRLTIRVKAPAGVGAKGKVTVFDRGRRVATVKVPRSGKKVVTVRISKKVGKHSITVRYAGGASLTAARATTEVTAKK